MAIQKRRVLFTKVVINGNISFENILLNDEFISFRTTFRNKTVEISHVENEKNHITGIFVATQKKDIAPVHTPGIEDDYSAVDLGTDKGFAYPSVFLYDKEKQVLLFEVNYYGVNETGIEKFFNDIDTLLLEPNPSAETRFKVQLLPLMKTDIRGRVRNMWRINKVELQVAKPNLIRAQNIEQNGLLASAVNIANNIQANKGINISLMGSKDNLFNTITKEKILELVRDFTSIPHSNDRNFKDRLTIAGDIQDDEGNIIEDAINVMVDRLSYYFQLEIEEISSSIYAEIRKQQIRIVHSATYNDILHSI